MGAILWCTYGPYSGEGLQNAGIIKVWGAFIVVLCIVEFGLGGAAYGTFTNVHYGAWWGAIGPLLCSVIPLFSTHRLVITLVSMMSVASVICAIVGASVDGNAATYFLDFRGCYNTETQEGSGSLYGQGAAKTCSEDTITTYFGTYSNNDAIHTQCICSNNHKCIGFDLADGDDCGVVLEDYPALLRVSSIVLIVILFATLFLSVLLICGCVYYGVPIPDAVTAPSPVMLQSNPAGTIPAPDGPYAIAGSQPVYYSTVPAVQPQQHQIEMVYGTVIQEPPVGVIVGYSSVPVADSM